MKISKMTFTYVVIVLVMLNNIEHLAFVHFSIARHWFQFNWMNYAHSVAVVVIVELSIIELVRRGKVAFAGFFAFCLFILSLIYYPLDSYIQQGAWGSFFAAVIYSAMFTISIYYFSILAADQKEEQILTDSYQQKYYDASRSLADLQKKLALFESLQTEVEELRKYKVMDEANRTCPYCSQVFLTDNARRGHMANCKMKS